MKMKDKKLLKDLINDYCKEKGISKADFSRRAGVSGATLSSIENGHFDLNQRHNGKPAFRYA